MVLFVSSELSFGGFHQVSIYNLHKRFDGVFVVCINYRSLLQVHVVVVVAACHTKDLHHSSILYILRMLKSVKRSKKYYLLFIINIYRYIVVHSFIIHHVY